MFRDNNVVVEENIPFVFENFTVDIYEIFSMIFSICHQNRIKIHLTINRFDTLYQTDLDM